MSPDAARRLLGQHRRAPYGGKGCSGACPGADSGRPHPPRSRWAQTVRQGARAPGPLPEQVAGDLLGGGGCESLGQPDALRGRCGEARPAHRRLSIADLAPAL